LIKRLFAIGFIFCCTSVAWMILGSAINTRTLSTDVNLRQQVQSIWGSPQAQTAPDALATAVKQIQTESTVDGKKVITNTNVKEPYPLTLTATDINADIKLDHRQKGLLWYATYGVDFRSRYEFSGATKDGEEVEITLPLPAQNATYDGFVFAVRGHPWLAKPLSKDGKWIGKIKAVGVETLTLDVAYRTQGLDSWSYQFGQGVSEVKSFRLGMTTDFADIDFPSESLSPTTKQKTETGWQLDWKYDSLVAGVNIGMVMPQKLQPGPLAGQISFFAPISLFFFIVVVLVIALIKKIEIHPMHFFFLSAAFFAFHLLLAYLADQVSIHWAFVISAVVSIFLVVSYLRVAIGNRFAFVEAGLAQLVYLILFSYAFFFEGLTGLAITIGAILTLFVMMQLTAKINWNDVFAKKATQG
jgi:Inner membrane protein CreD